MPKLELVGDVKIKFHDYQNSASTISDKVSYGDVDFIIGLDFHYPLGDRKSKAEYDNALLLLKRFKLEQQIVQDRFTEQIADIMIGQITISETIKLKNQALASLRKRSRSQKIKYNNAEIDINDFIDTENLILNTEIDLLGLKLDYIRLYFEYKRLVDAS